MSWPEVKKINSDLNTPLNEGGVKIVKSKQIGVYNGNADGSEKTIAISAVDASKCHITLFPETTFSGTSGFNSYNVRLTEFSNEYFKTVGARTYDGNYRTNGAITVTYEIIEFY